MPVRDQPLRVRVKHAIREAWPDIAEESITEAGLDVGRLTQLLQEHHGHDVDDPETEARTLLVNALLPINGGNAGWVEVLPEVDETPVARGQLYLHDTTPDISAGPPAGAITHLRVREDAQPLAAGPYRVRFEDSGEIRPIVTVTDQSAALPDMVAVVFMDDGQPVTVMELAEGD